MRIGYSRAARIVDLMEEAGIIAEQNGSKPREVLIDRWPPNDDQDDYADDDVEDQEEDDEGEEDQDREGIYDEDEEMDDHDAEGADDADENDD